MKAYPLTRDHRVSRLFPDSGIGSDAGPLTARSTLFGPGSELLGNSSCLLRGVFGEDLVSDMMSGV